ncbi:MAG: ABC transporter substrate-binding protein [Burkholderiales bacterium]|nr:ABC transporter substrate-binding protein [Burkholderiales bacterium]
MRRRRHLLAAGVILAGLAFARPASAQEAPDALIKRVVSEVTSVIDSDREIRAGNRQKITALVDSRIVPHLNFQAMTRTATGRHWPRATADQQRALVREFSRLLINTYAGALSNYRPETTIEYRPLRLEAGETEAVVRSTLKSKGGEPIQFDYYLERVDGAWKVIDLNVLGARLVETYKNQFNSVINADGIDGLIRMLSEKNRAVEARTRG